MRCDKSLARAINVGGLDATLSLANISLAPLFDADRFNLDESRGILGLEASEFVHGRFTLIVQALVREPALNGDIALIEAEPDGSIDSPLAAWDSAGNKLPLGAEEVAVVENLGKVVGDELIPQGTDVPVESQALDVHMGYAEDGSGGGLVATTALDANEAVLYDVDAADTISTSGGVESEEDVDGIGVGILIIGKDDFDRETALKLDGETFWSVGSIGWGLGELPHVVRRSAVGVFEDAGFVGDVEQVLVGRPWLGGSLLRRNILLGSVFEKSRSAGKAVVKFRDSPGGDDLDIGLQAIEGEFESDLIVTFASAAVGDELAVLASCDFDHSSGNDRAGKGSSKEVDTLVNGVRLHGWIDQLRDELPLQVLQEELLGSDLQGLLAGGLKVLLLSDISHESIDLIPLLDEPCKNARGIKTTRVSKKDTSLRFRHIEK